jgi:hypothetical protein
MVRVRMPVRRGVTVGRAVAAPDVAARHAQPQVIPPSATAQAVLAALTRGHDVVDQLEMAAGGCHGAAPFGRLMGDAAATMGHFQRDPPVLPSRQRGSERSKFHCRETDTSRPSRPRPDRHSRRRHHRRARGMVWAELQTERLKGMTMLPAPSTAPATSVPGSRRTRPSAVCRPRGLAMRNVATERRRGRCLSRAIPA